MRSSANTFTDDRSERGAVLALGAAGIGAVLLVAALVIDLGSARVDRSANQVVTDSAAAAAVVRLADGSGKEACEIARAYIEAHLRDTTSLDCSAMPIACDSNTPSRRATGETGSLRIMLTHPVDDTDPMMDSGSTSAPEQAISSADGHRCDRFGVRIAEPRSSLFSAITRSDPGWTAVHSVGRASVGAAEDAVINLLLLERTDCEALSIGGGGSSGGISVAPVVDPTTGQIEPGRIAIDSDGTGPTCGSRGTVHANGSGATIRADGPPGCAAELPPVGSGHGCGRLQTYAPGAPGCALPACSSSGVVAPPPVDARRRLTRAPIDHRYNCKPAYPMAFGIDGCSETASRTAYIDDLIHSVATYGGFARYRADGGFNCTINGNGATVVVPEGNWIVDCSDLRVGRELVFEGGNIIFEGDLTLGSQGVLRTNVNNTSGYFWNPAAMIDHRMHSANAAFVFFEDGVLTKGGGATLELRSTTVYLSPTSELKLGGGAGSLIWSGPKEGPFEDLALWSDSAADHGFAGSATLALEGVFFTPHARMVYTGNGGQASVQAQFIARTASAQGNGSLEIAPRWERAIKHPPPIESGLIR